MGQKLSEQVSQAEAQLMSRANVISETFAAVGQHIGQSTNEAARTIGTNTRELNAMLAERSAEITKILDETARPLVDRFSETGDELAKTLDDVTTRCHRSAARRERDAGQRARQPHRRDARRRSRARAATFRKASTA